MEKSKSSGTDFWCTRKYLAKKGMEPLFLFDYLYGGGSESLKTYAILFIESFSESIKKSETICQDLLTGIQKIYQSLQDVTHFYDQCQNCGANYGSYQEFINQECHYCGYKVSIEG
jgi:DNA-directed RNA polymerase subunit RPC12/RpoP